MFLNVHKSNSANLSFGQGYTVNGVVKHDEFKSNCEYVEKCKKLNSNWLSYDAIFKGNEIWI